MKSNRTELRAELAKQLQILQDMIDFTALLLQNKQYKRAEELLFTIKDLDECIARLESTATKLDEEMVL